MRPRRYWCTVWSTPLESRRHSSMTSSQTAAFALEDELLDERRLRTGSAR